MRRLGVAALILVLAACTGQPQEPEPTRASTPGAPGTLRVLAGSELEDLDGVLDEVESRTGVRVQLEYVGTLDGAQAVADGTAEKRYDAVWFSSNRYLGLVPGARNRLGAQQKIMTSPVVFGLRQSVARSLGWDARPVAWSEIAQAAASKKFTFGMTDPSASNSGFSALVGVAAALSGSGDALTTADVAKVGPQLTKLFSGQALTAGSSGWLADAFAQRATGKAPGGPVDGLINYESVLLSLNATANLPEPLTIVYPSDGVVTADYPLTLLTSAKPAARDAFTRVVDELRSPDRQREIQDTTRRRPIDPTVPLPEPLRGRTLVELPFPARRDAVDALLTAYQDEIRRPSRTVYVLDTSGSMKGDRIAGLQAALTALTGADSSLSGRFARFRSREEVTLLAFSSTVAAPVTVTVPPGDPNAALARIRSAIEDLRIGGDTAVYRALDRAYALLRTRTSADGPVTSIVLMTDGENTEGPELPDFRRTFAGYPAAQRAIPVYPVLFGESREAEMKEVAGMTGGRTFDARTDSLTTVFKEIRGYQ
ncbi:VWA domain-containing protein [Cryptosporangium aurantiacum]|uniref:Ca-activated chloride channel family protein n=1 Tax=Cryptosporangium aurantiacum TaxID=134849 RepID=A0A1M7RP92_9ACTN|nr:VWA domain-containing protein [Cryptosporangium aurantiacum]SHN48123.1 Ca-activated chloride channel family protein [Cryptosporangium aurantiacum]